MKLRNILIIATLGIGLTMVAQKPHVYINPGHGGHDSDDRNVVVAPFVQGDTAGFWESNSNLKKGFALDQILRAKGYTTSMSRKTNDTGSDLNLSTIVSLSNNSGADIFIAIHSNATGTTARANYPMGLYRGYTGQPEIAGSDRLAYVLDERLITNQATYWTGTYRLYGDWTFYPQWGDKVGLGVLRGNKVVSMLSEGSFHDYIPETYRLLNNDFCWLEGWNLSLGVDDYFGYNDFDKGLIAGNLRDERLLRNASYDMFGDDRRNPVSNAVVILQNASGTELARTTTDALFNGIYMFRNLAPGNYRVVVQGPEHYEAAKDVTVTANRASYANFDLMRVRSTPPEVVNYTPVWQSGDRPVMCNVPLVLEFNWDMNATTTEQAFHITPAVEGTFRWEDANYRMIFEPTDAFEVGTLYTVTLDKTATHNGDITMTAPFTMQFLTTDRNHIEVLTTFPADGDVIHYKSPIVEIRTDSLLTTADIFNNIIVKDASDAQLTLNRRSYKFGKEGNPYGFAQFPVSTAMTAGSEYTVTFNQALADTAGIHLDRTIVNHFTAIDMAQLPEDGAVSVAAALEAATDVTVAGEGTATLSAATDCLFGSRSLQLKYAFEQKGETVGLLLATPSTVAFGPNDALGLYLSGDLSFNEVAVQLTSASTGKNVLLPLGIINHHGWKYYQANTSGLDADDYAFSAVVITKTEGIMGADGTVKVDNVIKAKPTEEGLPGDVNSDGSVNAGDVSAVYNVMLGVETDATIISRADVNRDGSVNAGDVSAVYTIMISGSAAAPAVTPAIPTTTLRYNRGDDYAVAGADSFVDAMQLIGADGQLVVNSGANFINMTDVPAGAYAVRVYHAGQVTTFYITK